MWVIILPLYTTILLFHFIKKKFFYITIPVKNEERSSKLVWFDFDRVCIVCELQSFFYDRFQDVTDV